MREGWIMAPFALSLSLPRSQGAGCLVVEKLSEGVLVLWLPRQRGLLWFGQNSSDSKMEMLVNESHLEHTDVEVGKESAPSPLTEFRERLVSRPASRRWTMGFQAGPVLPEQRNWSRAGLKTFWKPAEPKGERAREGDKNPGPLKSFHLHWEAGRWQREGRQFLFQTVCSRRDDQRCLCYESMEEMGKRR